MKHRNLKNIFCYNSSFSSLVSSFGLGGGGGYFFVFPTKTKRGALRKNGIKLLRNVWSDSEDLTKRWRQENEPKTNTDIYPFHGSTTHINLFMDNVPI